MSNVTVITMHRYWDAEVFTSVVNGVLTGEEMDAWRKSHNCDGEDDSLNSMSFTTLELLQSHKPIDLENVDEETHP